jgi:hypothetical protein
MAAAHVADASRPPHDTARPYETGAPLILPGVEVVREGRVEPFLHAHPTLSSAAVRWAGLAVETTPSQRASYRDTSTSRTSYTWCCVGRSNTRC